MNEIRTLKKTVKLYIELLENDPEEAKADKDNYYADVKKLIDIADSMMEDTTEIFQFWCDVSVAVFMYPENNVFQIIKQRLSMMVVNHYLSKYSREMHEIGKLQTSLDFIEKRFKQFKYMIRS